MIIHEKATNANDVSRKSAMKVFDLNWIMFSMLVIRQQEEVTTSICTSVCLPVPNVRLFLSQSFSHFVCSSAPLCHPSPSVGGFWWTTYVPVLWFFYILLIVFVVNHWYSCHIKSSRAGKMRTFVLSFHSPSTLV